MLNVNPLPGSPHNQPLQSLDDYKLKLDVEKLNIEKEKLVLEREKAARARWIQEDSLVHNRLTWLLQTQGFLFAAFGLLLKEQASKEAKANHVAIGELLSGIPLFGMSICVIILMGIAGAWGAQWVLGRKYSELQGQLSVSTLTTVLGRTTGVGLPILIAAAWTFILCAEDSWSPRAPVASQHVLKAPADSSALQMSLGGPTVARLSYSEVRVCELRSRKGEVIGNENEADAAQ